ncbi:MAG: hypothetical protein ACI4ME_01995 [Aristaeellaceae bacterium]
MLDIYMLLVLGWCIVHFLMHRFLNTKALRIVSTLFTLLWAIAVLFLTIFKPHACAGDPHQAHSLCR